MTAARAPAIETIQRLCAGTFQVSLIDLCSQRRDAQSVLARHTAIWLTRRLTKHSTSAIGRHFGDRDHTTVLYAISRMEHRIDHDPGIGNVVLGLMDCLTLPAAPV